MSKELSVIILAAGKGTRMKSELAKVLHPALGRPLLDWVIDQADAAGAQRRVVVVGHQREAVMDAVRERGVEFAVQDQQLGTGHAVQMCASLFAGREGEVIVLSGDVPLLGANTLRKLVEQHRGQGVKATVLTAQFEDPSGYGRLIRDEAGRVQRIVEHKDATPAELAVKEINSGIYVFDLQALFTYIQRLDQDNAQGELYLTDVVRYLVQDGEAVGALLTEDPEEIQGVNTLEQLAAVEEALRSQQQ